MRNFTHNPQSEVQREEIDPVLKQVLAFRFGQLNIPLQTQVEVSRLPRTIDAVVRLHTPQEVERVQLQTPFSHFRAHNAIEFKGINDALTIAKYHLILGRAYLYLGENELLPNQMTVTIICARKPRQVLSRRQGIPFQSLGNGHYVHHNNGLTVHLIVINELMIVPENYSLLLFASSAKKFRQFLQRIVEEENWNYIRFAYRLRPRITKEVLIMAGKHSLPKADLEFMAKDIGPELLAFLTPEERLQGLGPETLLEHLSLRDLLRHLSTQAQRRQLNAEERRLLKQALENLDK